MYKVDKTDVVTVSSFTLRKGSAVVSHTVEGSRPGGATGGGWGERLRLSQNGSHPRLRADLRRGHKSW